MALDECNWMAEEQRNEDCLTIKIAFRLNAFVDLNSLHSIQSFGESIGYSSYIYCLSHHQLDMVELNRCHQQSSLPAPDKIILWMFFGKFKCKFNEFHEWK